MRKFLFALTFVLSIFMATNTQAGMGPGYWDAQQAQKIARGEKSAYDLTPDKIRPINKVTSTSYASGLVDHINNSKLHPNADYGMTYVRPQVLKSDIKKIIENIEDSIKDNGDIMEGTYKVTGKGSAQAMANFMYYTKSLNNKKCQDKKNQENACANTALAYLQEMSKQANKKAKECDDKIAAEKNEEKRKTQEKKCDTLFEELEYLFEDMKKEIIDKYGSETTKNLCLFGTARVRTYNFNERLKTFYGISGEADGSNLLGAELKSIMGFGNGCWFCGIFEKIFDLINELATRLYALLSGWFQALLAIMGFAAILFMVGKFFLTFHGTNIGQEYTNLFQMIGRMMLAFALLHASVGEVFGLFIRPFFSFTGALVDAINAVESPAAGGMVISLSQINITQTGNCSAEDLQGVANKIQAEVKSMCIDETQNPYGTFTFDGKEAAFDATMRSVLGCMLKTTSAALLVGMAQGAATMELSNEKGFMYKDIIPNFGMLIFGLIQFIAFLYLYIMTPIKLLDVLIRFGFVAIMMPLWIVFWVFKTTRGYTKKAWDIIMTSLFYLVSLTIMLLLALKILGA